MDEPSAQPDLAAALPDKRYARLTPFGDQDALNKALLAAVEEGALLPSGDSRSLASKFSQQVLLRRLIEVITAAGAV